MIALNKTDLIYHRTQNVPEKGQIIIKKVNLTTINQKHTKKWYLMFIMRFPCLN